MSAGKASWRAAPEMPAVVFKEVEYVPERNFYVKYITTMIDESGRRSVKLSIESDDTETIETMGPIRGEDEQTTSTGVRYAEYLMRTENLFFRFWYDGRLAVGRFAPSRSEDFFFGILKFDKISTIPGQEDAFHDLPFEKWFKATGRGVEERKAF
ncbi:Hypothetical protein D9617_15g043040 [Elsinoe fawcettii]|nr:Hypothetical protein D9617_15g043040 [Elsinoe fawcettii]